MNAPGLTLQVVNGQKGLDPITVVWLDLEPGKGKLIIECYGRAWASYWNAIGDRSLRSFVTTCDVDYLAGSLCGGVRMNKYDTAYLKRIIQAVQADLSAGGGA